MMVGASHLMQGIVLQFYKLILAISPKQKMFSLTPTAFELTEGSVEETWKRSLTYISPDFEMHELKFFFM